MGEPQLKLMVKPHEFFREKICEALANQKLNVGDEIEFYLVNLLCEFIQPNKLETSVGDMKALDTPLAIILKNALEAPPPQQLRLYKYLGDTSLYFAGFFQDYFNRKTFDVDYYITVGSSAYTSVSSIMRDRHADEHFSAMYQDLAERFSSLVEVVAEVSEQRQDTSIVDVLSIYERWSRTQSERLRRLLERRGIHPIPTSREKQ